MKLLTKAAQRLSMRGPDQVDSIEDIDREGIAFLPFRGDEANYLLRAKEYLYREKAPFSPLQVQKANEWDAMLLLYVDSQSTFYVFDPKFVRKNATVDYGQSKLSDGKKWLETETQYGVTLTAYENGAEPTTVGEIVVETEPDQNSLTDY